MAKLETSAPVTTVARKSFSDLTGVSASLREDVLSALVRRGDGAATADLIIARLETLLGKMQNATTPEAVLTLAASLGGIYQTGGKARNVAGISLPVGRPRKG